MLQQAKDLMEEGQELYQLLQKLSVQDWKRKTPFKQWDVNQIVQHLHGSDKAAVLSLKDGEEFKRRLSTRDLSLSITTTGVDLLHEWWEYFSEMCELLGASEPKRRLPWFGPDMGVMMFTTARQMETWSHGQDIYDLLGENRVNTNRLKNIAVIGVKTYGWTFANRNLEVPGPAPYVNLVSPTGESWTFNDRDEDNKVEGSAVDFCHVVTQGRNIRDVNLIVIGKPATEWMAIAQCFAGPPETPPVTGSREINF